MKYRRRQRWLRRLALGFAFATAMFAGKVSVAAAVVDEGGKGSTIVSAGGWSGAVDPDSGIPLSAGIPQGDEQFISGENVQVVPYLSHGILTQEQAQQAATSPAGDEIAFRNALDSQALAFANAVVAAAESLHDPLGSEGSSSILGEAVKTRQAPEPYIPFVTDFPKPESAPTRPDDQATRFSGPENPPVISYLSHGMGADGEVGARPDNRADRFSPGDVAPQTRLEVSGSTDWETPMTYGIGAALLALALGLGLGYLRRPRLAL